MVDKIVLTALTNVQATTTGVTQINTNFSTIETAMNNTLSRDGTSPNQMAAVIDMNSNKIINLGAPVNPNDAARLTDIGAAATVGATVLAAASSAAISAISASSSMASAITSASSATASASSATTSAAAAASSAAAAVVSANTAANSAAANIYQFDTSTTMAAPAAGFLRLNNAAIGSVTHIAFAAASADNGNPAIEPWIATWANSTNTVKGYVEIRDVTTNASNFLVATISALTDHPSTWTDVTVAIVASGGTFAASDKLSVIFSRAGDAGANGSGVSGQTNHSVVVAASASTLGTGVLLTAGQTIIGVTGADPVGAVLSGDVTTVSNAGAVTIGKVNGVAYPSGPSTNTVPVVTGANTITYSTIPVAAGGTGVATLTAHNILLGEGTSNVGFLSLATGKIPVGVTASDPIASSLIFSDETNGAFGIGTNTPFVDNSSKLGLVVRKDINDTSGVTIYNNTSAGGAVARLQYKGGTGTANTGVYDNAGAPYYLCQGVSLSHSYFDMPDFTFRNQSAVIQATIGVTSGVVNAITGYQVNALAPSGNVLRGNGTNFVSATLASTDLSDTAHILRDNVTDSLTAGYTANTTASVSVTGANQTTTPGVGNAQSNFQIYTLNGSSLTGTWTFAVPANDGSYVVQVINGGSGAVAAALSTATYTKVTGDTWASTNGNVYNFYVVRINSKYHLHITQT